MTIHNHSYFDIDAIKQVLQTFPFTWKNIEAFKKRKAYDIHWINSYAAITNTNVEKTSNHSDNI